MILGYACGPMGGLSLDKASDWRKDLTRHFKENTNNIRIVSPTRGKAPTDRITVGYDNSFKSESQYIYKRDKHDITKCDFLFVHFPTTVKPLSIGSLIEIGWATMLDKPIFVVTHNKRIASHALIKEPAVWVGDDICKAVEAVIDYYAEVY